ncbi:MAG: hypothetical protein ABIH89_01440 [Elusimicrobiota bacterium]
MLDFTRILKELSENNVEYMVVGGIAVNLHGIPRMTYDLDLLVNMTDENLDRFMRIIKKLKYTAKVPVDIMDFAVKEKRRKWIEEKNMKAFCLVNNKATVKEIDIIIDAPVSYQNAKKNMITMELQNISVPVIGIADLIKMKEKTGRRQDDSDIRYLKKKINEE